MILSSLKPNEAKCNFVAERCPVERIIRIDEMLKLLNVSRTTLYRWSKNGTFIKPITYEERTIGWAHSDYQNWLLRA